MLKLHNYISVAIISVAFFFGLPELERQRILAIDSGSFSMGSWPPHPCK